MRKKPVVNRTAVDKLSFFFTRLDEQNVPLFVSLIRSITENEPVKNDH